VKASAVLCGIATFALTVTTAQAQDATDSKLAAPVIRSARDGIFEAFKTHPIVAIGDSHDLTQEVDFYMDLVRDPRFAQEINNIVVEFGDAAQQGTIDRYLNGENVPYDELRKVWSDTVGWSPAVTSQAYVDFFVQVRTVNAALPSNQRIHVWLGDPPIDWSVIKTRSDVKAQSQRNSFPAELIRTKILAEKRKAVVIYGAFHFYGKNSVRGLVEAAFPGSFFLITPYSGYPNNTCSVRLEKHFTTWPVPAIVGPIRGTLLAKELSAPDCRFREGAVVFWPPEVTDAEKLSSIAAWEEESSGVSGDALLYMGRAETLTYSPPIPDFYLDVTFRAEIDRRAKIMSGSSMWLVPPSKTSPSFVHSAEDLDKHK
jgi:hypothetical protein